MFAKLKQFQEEREEGFTLIELLVVILIIGILSAIAIPAFLNQRKSAVDSSVQSDISNAAKQIETFVVKSGATAKPLKIVTADTPPVPTAIGEIKTSDGTTLVITGDTFHYKIVGTNPGGDESTTAKGGFIYDSAAGGMVETATTIAGTSVVTVTNSTPVQTTP